MDSKQSILPPCTLGILGGGQLGRFFVEAAHDLGYAVWVLEPDNESPAGKIADRHLCAPYTDSDALQLMAKNCSAISLEFENIPVEALEILSAETRVFPSTKALAICQNRQMEKQFLVRNNFPVVEYCFINVENDCHQVQDEFFPAILKLANSGYDGKGQQIVNSKTELTKIWQGWQQNCVLERKVNLQGEISVVVVRDNQGESLCYPLVENKHKNGILEMTISPIDNELCPLLLQEKAQNLSLEIARQLDYTGVLAVEFFIVNGDILVNEIAPRPHNSGHISLDNGACSQFEQQVRVLCGLPLGNCQPLLASVMVNCLGDLWFSGGVELQEPNWPAILQIPHLHLHLYGKKLAKRARKMGHFTVCAQNRNIAIQQANIARELIMKI